MKGIILFDIDYTLIDTDVIKKNVLTYLCTNFEVDINTAVATRNAYLHGLDSSSDLDHSELIKHFSKKFDQKLKVSRKDIYKSSVVFANTTYADVRPALNKLSSRCRLGIYSEGFMKFQRAKLEMNGLIDFFDPELMFIKRRKLDPEVVSSLPSGSIVVDDKLSVVETLQSAKQLNPIWLNRFAEKETPPYKTISSLKFL